METKQSHTPENKTWKDHCREAGNCNCDDVCMFYTPTVTTAAKLEEALEENKKLKEEISEHQRIAMEKGAVIDSHCRLIRRQEDIEKRLEKERDTLKEENERLDKDFNESISIAQSNRNQITKLQSLNRELLEGLKTLYRHDFGGNSISIEDAMARAPKGDTFEQTIISLIKKAEQL